MTNAADANAPLILVVDDDWMNREMMQAYLERSGFRVALAHDSASALEKAVELVPQLIMLDVRMGEKDGYEVCQELKAQPRTQAVPVVMLSALSNDEARTRARQAGANDFITKTMNLSSMVTQIRALLGHGG
jgi:DNA-binding response OmpR family regulator